MDEKELRESLVFWGRKVIEKKLVVGAGVNISAGYKDIMLISRSGLGFDELEPRDYVAVNLETGKTVSEGRPSSEVVMH